MAKQKAVKKTAEQESDASESKPKVIAKGETCSGFGCPLCTKEGLILVTIAFVLVAIDSRITNILGIALLLLAYAYPWVKTRF